MHPYTVEHGRGEMGGKGELTKKQQERIATVLEALQGRITPAEGARRLGLSRQHFSDLMKRTQESLVEGALPRASGRPARSEEEKRLKRELERTQRELQNVKKREQTKDRALSMMREVLYDQVKSARKKPSSRRGGPAKDGDEDDLMARLVKRLKDEGHRVCDIAASMGVSVSTVYRRLRRLVQGLPAVQRRGPGPSGPPSEKTVRQVNALVDESHGMMGAEALRHGVDGVSRRQASAIKKERMIHNERERRRKCTRIRMAHPGVVRGFDQKHLVMREGKMLALISSDAAIPYRTGVHVTAHYDEASVYEAIQNDIESNGPPLVLRMDNHKSHKTSKVVELLEEHEVLPLFGPPRYPQYYGQTEWMNGEHDRWLGFLEPLQGGDVLSVLRKMVHVLNCTWRRRTLGWQTAWEVWDRRPELDIDRGELKQQVTDLSSRIRRRIPERKDADQLSWRLAVEQALQKRGLLEVTHGAAVR